MYAYNIDWIKVQSTWKLYTKHTHIRLSCTPYSSRVHPIGFRRELVQWIGSMTFFSIWNTISIEILVQLVVVHILQEWIWNSKSNIKHQLNRLSFWDKTNNRLPRAIYEFNTPSRKLAQFVWWIYFHWDRNACINDLNFIQTFLGMYKPNLIELHCVL